MRQRGTEAQRDREAQRERQRGTERETERDRERETEREKQRERERKRERERENTFRDCEIKSYMFRKQSNTVSFSKLPNSGAIGPLRELPFSTSTARSVSPAKVVGINPVKQFNPSCRYLSCNRLPNSEGIGPFMLELARSKFVRVVRLPSCVGIVP